MLRMSVAGERSEADKAKPVVKAAGAVVLDSLGIGVTVADAVKVAGSRAVADQVVLEPAAGDDVLEVTLEGGVRLYLPAEQAPELLAAPPGRAAAVPGTIPLASSLAVGDGSRGIGDWVIEGLRLIGVDLAGRTAAAVAAGIDAHQVPKPGLYHWGSQALGPVEERLPEGKEPWLLFLHGTFSNTLGSFGALAAQGAQWRRLEAAYRDRILALDHHTLSRSPIENAEEVLARLPEGVGLHIVGYSRGGLIGELLCRGRLEGRILPFDETELGLFTGADRIEQRAALERLGTSLIALRPGIERYVRVACPARGTTLASDRLDRWLNFVLNAVGLGISAVASPLAGEMYDLVTAFLLAVIKERADASTIPGLEAMIPGAPLVRLLNRPGVTAATDLAVLEGDIEGAGILGRLKVLATDLFFREDHDLVVNTSAMDGGMARNPPARASFTQGPEVSHFTYFSTPKTAERVVEGLLRPDDQDGGFKQIPAEEVGVVTAPAKRGGERRPVVFVLPGITGTVLGCIDKGRERRIWVDLPQLAFGGLRRLAIDQSDIVAKEPLSLYYGELCDFLGGTHDVRPWGYDWRRSILDNAKAFATVLGNALTATDQPVRIVAHSMGGLVARSAFLDAKLWQRFQDRAGSRLIQLGTPNGGSWSIPYMLMGRDTLMGYLATLDFTMSRREQQQVVVRFPGALQMLPHTEASLFDPARWTALAQLDPGGDWGAPRADDLAIAARFRDAFAKAPCDPDRLLYVAGHAPTMVGIEEDPAAAAGQRIRFRTTTEGDGQVPWSTGIPPGIRAWYADAVHGDLARHEPAFPAILDLLETGTTSLLPTTPPAAARGRSVPSPKVRDTVSMFPDAEDLLLAGMGGSHKAQAVDRQPKIEIRVVHGHLAFARHPVMVGHYAGDTINGAERQLDQALGGRLVKRKQLGLYPGALGTNTVVLDRRTRPQGAIVVGLGDHADLAPGTLAETLRRGLLAYAVEDEDDRCAQGRGSAVQPLGVTALLVGAGVGGLPIASSVEALLRAVLEAQRALEGQGLRQLELLELVEDRAIRAWHELDRALQGSEFSGRFALVPAVKVTRGGRRNVTGDDDPTWWQPIQITMEEIGGEQVMRYVTTAGRARAEASLVPGETGFVERFVAQATGAAATGGGTAAAAGRALYELLWPERIKETSREDRNLRLVVDEKAAAFPWELLDDRRPWLRSAASGGGEPPKPAAVRSGLVRQLVQSQFREKVAAPAGHKRALVVGDPRAQPESGFAPLPGAEEEAYLVAERLKRAGYEVTHLAGAAVAPEQVVAALFDQAWNILHIAAHGVVNHEHLGPDGARSKQTGIVLGGGLFLGPSILDRLAVVPAIVFVNCCHIGRIDPTAEADRLAQLGRRPNLAASVAVQLVRMGVRGVVAAGWAVDDVNAGRFADRFYEGVLGGLAFGRAVLEARKAIYRAGGQDTTWGAYQCYGEPDWRMADDVAEQGQGSLRALPSLAEAVALAEQIREAAQVGLDRDHDGQRARLDALNLARRRNRFLDCPELQVALAEAYGELGSLQKAVRYYDSAIGAQRGAVPLRALEQRANLMARHAVRSLAPRPTKKQRATAVATIEAAVGSLDSLIALAGPTVERQNLRGSAYKRLASVQRGKDRADALVLMRAAYAEAQTLALGLGDDAFYSELMVLTAEVLEQHLSGTGDARARSERLRAIAATQRARAEPDDFWAGVAVGDALLLAAIGDGVISAEEEGEIVAAYLDPWRRGGSRLKLSSVTEQLEFLAAMLADGPDATEQARQALIVSLNRIRGRVAKPG